jgi:signal transduction histidine kinase
VSNAVKFTDRGSVTLTARVSTEQPAPALPNPEEGAAPAPLPPRRWIEVSVADTGCGIAPDALPRVFDRFYRADTARVQSGGTGLGLAIARMIAEQHGGGISARSTLDRGSVFTVRLPARAPGAS